jgi:sigma-E factor negative regulatory protein RseC
MIEAQVSVSARVVHAGATSCAVKLVEQSGCGGCVQSGICGVPREPAIQQLELESCSTENAQLAAGAEVTLAVPAPRLLRLALTIYLLPAVLLLVGAALGNALLAGSGDVGGASGALAGLLLGWACIRLYDSRCGGYRWAGRLSAHGLTLDLVRRAS